MNEQDEKAYETWANGFRYRMDIHARQAWQACCEYKDKQVDAALSIAESHSDTVNNLIEQLAAKDAVIAQMWEALKDATETIEFTSGTDMSCDPKEDCSDYWRLLNAHNDDSALQEAIKQAKREALLWVASVLVIPEDITGYTEANIKDWLRNVAEEIK